MELKLSELSPITIDYIYLTLLDFQCRFEMGSNDLVSMPLQFEHESDLIRKGHYDDHRREAVEKLQKLRVLLGPVDEILRTNAAEILGGGFVRMVDIRKLKNLRSKLESIRATKGMGPVRGPMSLETTQKQVKREWKNLEVELIENDRIKYRFAGQRWIWANRAELGLDDRRGSVKDTKPWIIFCSFAATEGTITYQQGKTDPTGVKTISRLRKKLSEVFRIEESPFYPYTKRDGYHLKFSIKDRHGSRETISQDSDSTEPPETYPQGQQPDQEEAD